MFIYIKLRRGSVKWTRGILGSAGLSATEGPCGKSFAGGIGNDLSQMPQCWPWSCRGCQGSRQGASTGGRFVSTPPAAPHCTGRFSASFPTSTNRILKNPQILHSPLPSFKPGGKCSCAHHSPTLIQVFRRSWSFIPGSIMCLLSPAPHWDTAGVWSTLSGKIR